MTDKRKIYASAEESKAVLRDIPVTPAHLELLRLIDERGMNEQGVSNARYMQEIFDICAQLLDQVRNLEAALERQASSGKDWAMRVDVLERTITTLRAQLAASSAQAGAAEKALRELESANSIALQLDARIKELEAQLESIGAGGVEPLRRDHFRGVTKMVHVGWAISYDGKNPHALWTAGEGDLLDLEVKRQGGTACKMELYAMVEKPIAHDHDTPRP